MIEINNFKKFIYEHFDEKKIFYDDFKQNLHFIEIDCFNKTIKRKFAIEVSSDEIKFSSISIVPEIDFSLYEHSVINNYDAQLFVLQVIKDGDLPPR